jgi:TatA/E family protein of Tat protein translocase
MNLLFLNDVGTGEFVLILFVILMLFGSKGLPEFARNLGRGMRQIRDASNEIQRDIQNSATEMRRDMNVPTIEELTKTPDNGISKELKEIENLAKIEEEKPKQVYPVNPVNPDASKDNLTSSS